MTCFFNAKIEILAKHRVLLLNRNKGDGGREITVLLRGLWEIRVFVEISHSVRLLSLIFSQAKPHSQHDAYAETYLQAEF